MNIKPTKAMITFLVSNAFGLAVVGTLLVVHYYLSRPAVFLFLYLLCMAGFIAIISALVYDLLSGRTKTIRGKVIQKEGKIVHLLTDDGKLASVKVHHHAGRERLEPGRHVEIALTKLTDYPVSIHFPEEAATRHPS